LRATLPDERLRLADELIDHIDTERLRSLIE
jgi:hypothetical protein